jgi:hypothetical protein
LPRIALGVPVMPDHPPPGTYPVVTGRGCPPDEATRGLFPADAAVVLVDTEVYGHTVSYTFLVDYPEVTA